MRFVVSGNPWIVCCLLIVSNAILAIQSVPLHLPRRSGRILHLRDLSKFRSSVERSVEYVCRTFAVLSKEMSFEIIARDFLKLRINCRAE
jgi:hypothetical protein